MFKKILGLFSKPKKQDPAQQTKIEQSYFSAKSNIKSLTKDVATLTAELEYMSGSAKEKAAQLLGQAGQRLPLLETQLKGAYAVGKLTEGEAASLYWQTVEVKNSLSVLRQRKIYRNNLQLLQAQLATQQLTVLTEELKDQLHLNVAEQQQQIELAANPELQGIYQQNLSLYQEMLAGKRPYAPLKLLNEINHNEQQLAKLDAELVS